jgi:serine phosphatase RsbU (regulator of sigma subunit)/CHASE3 domain sensor protein
MVRARPGGSSVHRRARRERGSLRGTLIRLSGGLAVVLALLILTSVAGTIIATRDYRDTGLRAERRQTAANQLLVDLLDAETGSRGYVLTAGGGYLKPYTQARKRYPDDLARLYELVRGEAELERSADAVDARAQLWFSEAVELIRLRRAGQVGDARERLGQGQARDRFDAFRTEYAGLADGLRVSSQRSISNADRQRTLTIAAVILTAFLALAMVILASRQLWRRVGGPLRLLALGVGRVTRGRLSDPVPPSPQAVRELSELTDGFNTMQRQVSQQREAVTAAARREATQKTERRLWETVQNGLLPTRLPGYQGFRVAARYRPAERSLLIGGDFYDAVVLSDGRLAVMVGDMAGHGAPAAAQAAGLRFGWRTMVAVDPDPGRVLAALNAQMAQQELRREGLFASVLYALIDQDGVGLVAPAGHPPPIVVGRQGGRVIATPEPGPLLGVVDDATWPTTPVSLRRGETLLLFTDGLIEARRGDEQFGNDGVCAVMEAERASAVELRLSRLISAARRHDEESLRDDVVVLAVERVRGTGPPRAPFPRVASSSSPPASEAAEVERS